MNNKFLVIALLSALTFAPLAIAEGSEKKRKGDRNRGEGQRQVMIDACAGIAEGDACTIIGRDDQEVLGTCAAVREEVIACRVEREDGGKGRRGGMGGMGGKRGGKPSEEVQN